MCLGLSLFLCVYQESVCVSICVYASLCGFLRVLLCFCLCKSINSYLKYMLSTVYVSKYMYMWTCLCICVSSYAYVYHLSVNFCLFPCEYVFKPFHSLFRFCFVYLLVCVKVFDLWLVMFLKVCVYF